MKKTFLLISALILTAACAAPTTQQAPPANANVTTTPAIPPMTEADATAKERAIWDAIKNKDYEAFGNMVDEDQLEVTGAAVFDKAGSIAAIKEFEPDEVTFSDWKFLSIDRDAFIVTYTVSVKGKYKGKEFPVESARASSAWVHRSGKWLAKYHQECPVKTAPPPPPAKPGKETTAASSPAASPAMPTLGSDPIANEKLVWDLFRNKEYDKFATLLAPDFIEVEPIGVTDAAGTVAGVKQANLAKAELSDFQTLKLDDDAMLVVYTVKNPGFPPDGERHTTIWVKRDGKWHGLLHHGGTPVVKSAATPETKAAASPAAQK